MTLFLLTGALRGVTFARNASRAGRFWGPGGPLPMPWMNVNRLAEQDARALYRFIASLGPAGERMPLASAPRQEPATPYFLFEPVMPKGLEASNKAGLTDRQ